MKTSIGLLVLFLGAFVIGCEDDTATKFSLGPDGNSQDCAIGCKVAKNKKACDKWVEKTRENQRRPRPRVRASEDSRIELWTRCTIS